MGLFFDEKDDEKVVVKQENITPIIKQGFFGAFILMLFAGLFTMLSWIFKPLFTWMFTFEGRTRKQISIQMTTFFLLVGIPLLLLYRIPMIRDLISLQETHTINLHGNGGRILFPDRSHFIPSGSKKIVRMESYNDIIYLTYTGYNAHIAEKMEPSYCPLVPRSQKILLSSEYAPTRAEGFEDSVSFTVVTSGDTVRGFSYVMMVLSKPKLLFASKEKLSNIEVKEKKTGTWNELRNNWYSLETIHGTNSRWFEIQALSDEHAIVCF